MKIAILTIVDYNNYGNRLQNYALQNVLEKLGHDVVTVRNYHQFKPNVTTIQKIRKLFSFSWLKGKVDYVINKRKQQQRDKARVSNFLNFTNKYINESQQAYYNVNDDYGEFNDFDCFVVGSDQVWNYQFRRFSDIDFAGFTSKPKISYAASFGVSSIPSRLERFYKTGLSNFFAISVRETAGKELIKSLINKEPFVALDPTLLLSKDEWKSLTVNYPAYNEEYILLYFLGEPELETKEYIEYLSTKYNLKIKILGNPSDKDLWSADPFDFVNLFAQAKIVLTDSFHACVFSIIFNKNFEVFERNGTNGSMNSRMDTLLHDFHLENRWHRQGEKPTSTIDYKKVEELLNKRRNESISFLVETLSRIEGFVNNG